MKPANVKITADSNCDLSADLIAKYEIDILPLYINTETDSYRDGVNMTPPDLFRYVENTGNLPSTAACPTTDYIDLFEKHVKEGNTVVHFSISSGLSCSLQNAILAAQEVGNTYVVDSKNLSTGIGLCVLKGAEMAQDGASAEEIAVYMESMAKKVEASFVVDTLKYLHKGGRCSSLAKLGANLLHLKPCIEVIDGGMLVGKKYRGTLARCLTSYIEDRLKDRNDIDTRRIFITHSFCPPEIVELVRETVVKYQRFDEIIVTTAGCSISTHCGPNTLGILFVRK